MTLCLSTTSARTKVIAKSYIIINNVYYNTIVGSYNIAIYLENIIGILLFVTS